MPPIPKYKQLKSSCFQIFKNIISLKIDLYLHTHRFLISSNGLQSISEHKIKTRLWLVKITNKTKLVVYIIL